MFQSLSWQCNDREVARELTVMKLLPVMTSCSACDGPCYRTDEHDKYHLFIDVIIRSVERGCTRSQSTRSLCRVRYQKSRLPVGTRFSRCSFMGTVSRAYA
eukprot:6052738-Amphidinium_carterae.1